MAGSSFTAFAPFGAFRFSSRQTYGESIYRQLVNSEQAEGADAAFDSSWNSYNSCRLYAIAMGLQSAKLQLQHAAAQRDPRYVTEKLPELEKDYQLIPLPSATIEERRAALQAAMSRRDGNLVTAISAGMTTIFGAYFSSVRVQTTSETSAVLIGQTSLKTFDEFKPGIGHKLFKITEPISSVGAKTVAITSIGGTGEPPKVGERVIVDVSKNGRTEVVTVTASTSSTITATFSSAHDANAVCSTQHWPAWVNHKRHLLIYTSAAALDNAPLIAKANAFLDYALRGSSTWAFVPGESPFVIGTSRIGQNTIGAVVE